MDEINHLLSIVVDDNPLDLDDESAERIAREQIAAEDSKKATGNVESVNHESMSTSGQDALDGLLRVLNNGPAKPLVQLPNFPDFELGPGLVTIIGAPPAAGKTLLSMQMMFEGLECDDGLVSYVLNCEMTPQSLLQRELTRLTGIPAKKLRFGNLDNEDQQLLHSQTKTLRHRLERVRFVRTDPKSLTSLKTAKPGLVLLDYLQRFSLRDESDPRQAMNGLMAFCRQLADHGHSVLGISATKRSQDGKHTNNDLSLSSFRESGEIEYAADSCYVLKSQPQSPRQNRQAKLVCVKNRHAEPVDISLVLDTKALSFIPDPNGSKSIHQAGRQRDKELESGFYYGDDQ
jgi:hypothetical protein